MKANFGRRIVAVALVLLLALASCGWAAPAGATTVLEAYQQLKALPQYSQLVNDLVATGKCSSADVDDFVSELSGQLPAALSEGAFDKVFKDTALGLILHPQHADLLEACIELYGGQLDEILQGNLPSGLIGVRDAFKAILFGDVGVVGGLGLVIPVVAPFSADPVEANNQVQQQLSGIVQQIAGGSQQAVRYSWRLWCSQWWMPGWL